MLRFLSNSLHSELIMWAAGEHENNINRIHETKQGVDCLLLGHKATHINWSGKGTNYINYFVLTMKRMITIQIISLNAMS